MNFIASVVWFAVSQDTIDDTFDADVWQAIRTRSAASLDVAADSLITQAPSWEGTLKDLTRATLNL